MLKRFSIALAALFFFQGAFAQTLPPVELKYSSYAIAVDGRILGYYGEKNRIELQSTGLVSKHVIHALLATEDRDFYNHDGVSLKGLGRAILQTLSGKKQGGSTLTMQLARNLFLSHEQTISRKLAEIDLARELEKKYTKDQILLLYLNTVYFGRGAYGIWAAGQEYFGKTPDKLSLLESATIVGLLKAPSAYEPAKNPEKALSRRNEVLHNLVETGKLSQKDFNTLKKQPLNLNLREPIGKHFVEFVRREATEILKRQGKTLSGDEYRITTTLDILTQKSAEHAVEAQWKLFPSAMKNAQVGLVSIEPGTGAIRVMIGGNKESDPRGLNRAVQIRRQAGSAFKPFLYGSLLEQGYTLAIPFPDTPIVVDSGTVSEWRPANNDNTYSMEKVSMIHGMQYSLNLVAVHAMVEHTTPEQVAAFANRCGIISTLPLFPSLVLGTGGVSPLEMAAAMSVFPALGMRAKPFAIIRIEDKNRRVLYSASIDTNRALDAETAFLMTKALETVVDSGTATAIRRYYSGPAAGKTGTTQNSADAWFVGYTPDLSTAIWIGYDDPAMKLTGSFRYGGTACAPVWGRMTAELAKALPSQNMRSFQIPEMILEVELCDETGLLATPQCTKRRKYPVNSLLLPPQCPEHFVISHQED